jgi:iron complex outermembrane receptor protein
MAPLQESSLPNSQSISTSMNNLPTFRCRQTLLATLLANAFVPMSVPSVFAADAAAQPSTIVVTATRIEQSGFDIPVSIDSVSKEQLQDGRLQMNLAESMGRVPGLVVNNRNYLAGDTQISSRGFGARAGFGVRGLRLYSDGIPATMPDGQGQVSHFDLGSAAKVEVLRGPFSVLYGSSSGGVISVFTEDGAPGTQIEPSVVAGSYGSERLGVKVAGDNGTLNYVANATSYSTDGYRDHSAGKRELVNGKLRWHPDAVSSLTLVINAADMPDLQDPMGLTRQAYEANPRQAVSSAYSYNTRKSSDQQQLGAAYERKIGTDDTVNSTVYLGHRNNITFQSIPKLTQQSNSGHAGGVAALARDYWGVDLRWTHKGRLAAAPFTITAGVTYDDMDEARKGYENFIGSVLGVQGALRRDEDNHLYNFDQYLQAQWEPGEAWLLMAGLRRSSVTLSSKDKYIVGTNLDDSGTAKFSDVTPVLGATWRANDALNLYATVGNGFETPTMGELAYRTTGAGMNLGLQAAKSKNVELGIKTVLARNILLNVAWFEVRTESEIVVDTSLNGRTTYRNGGNTERKGLEAALSATWDNGFALALAYTDLTARYSDTLAGTSIRAGNYIPGIPRSTAYAEASWKHQPSGFSTALEVRSVSKIWVNDANNDAAAAKDIINLRFGLEQVSAGWKFKEFLRVDNIGDRKAIGSVIVNDGNNRYFEPEPGRNWLIGVNVAKSF